MRRPFHKNRPLFKRIPKQKYHHPSYAPQSRGTQPHVPEFVAPVPSPFFDPTPPPPPVPRCAFLFRDGRRCASLRCNYHSTLCAYHADKAEYAAILAMKSATGQTYCFQAPSNPAMTNLAPELFGPVKDLQTSASINHVLGRLAILIAANRIPVRYACAIAYICQLAAQTLPGLKAEKQGSVGMNAMEEQLRKVFKSLPNLSSALETPDKVVAETATSTDSR